MMATSEFDKHALSNRIAEKITHQIITGELKPGKNSWRTCTPRSSASAARPSAKPSTF